MFFDNSKICDKYLRLTADGDPASLLGSVCLFPGEKNLKVVELGAGTGLVGMTCAHLKDVFESVLLTDQTIALCEENIAMQPAETQKRLSAETLLWGTTDLGEKRASFDLVIASDVICHQEGDVMRDLLKSIRDLLKQDSGEALVAYEFRDDWWTTSQFCEIAEQEMGFDVETMSLEEDDPDSDYILYSLTRK